MIGKRPTTRPGLVALAGFLTFVVPALFGYFASYRLHADDFALVFNSSPPYFHLSDWTRWFTEGYSQYFANYPGWPSVGTDFSRPLVNAVFYLQGLLAPHIGESAFLLAGYIAAASTVFLMARLLTTYGLPVAMAVVLSVSVGLSPVWYSALFEAASATNALALFFTVAALLVLQPAKGVPRGARLGLCLGLQVAAIATHETAAIVPLVCVALLYALSPERPRLAQLLPFAIPLAVMAFGQAILRDAGDFYALENGRSPFDAERIKRFALNPLIPIDAKRFLGERHGLGVLGWIPYALGLAANAAVVVAVFVRLRRAPVLRAVAFAVALALAVTPTLLTFSEPRFGGFGLVVSLVIGLTLAHNASASSSRDWRWGVTLLVAASQVALFLSGPVALRDERTRHVAFAGSFFDSARSAIASHDPSAVVLVNDRVAYHGAAHMLKMAAWPREDVRPVTLNSYWGEPDAHARVTISRSRSTTRVVNRLGNGQRVDFTGARPDFSTENAGFRYRHITGVTSAGTGSFEASGVTPAGGTLVLGVDPRTGGILEPRRY